MTSNAVKYGSGPAAQRAGADRLEATPQLYGSETIDVSGRRLAFESDWMPLRASRAARFADKARRLERAGHDATWYRQRESSLGVWPTAREQWGRDNPVRLVSNETGELRETCRCKSPTCLACQNAKVAKFRRMANAVIATHDEIERNRVDDDGNPAPREPVLITLSCRHVGNPAVDESWIREAFPAFRSYLHRKIGKFTYLRREEITEGKGENAGLGHIHWHLAAWWPEFVDYRGLQHAWWRALGWDPDRDPETGEITCDCDEPRRRDGRPCSHHAPGNVDVQRRDPDETTAAAALSYCTETIDTIASFAYCLANLDGFDQLEPEALAAYVDSTYGRRMIQCSTGFWSVAEVPASPWAFDDTQDLPPTPSAQRGWWKRFFEVLAEVTEEPEPARHQPDWNWREFSKTLPPKPPPDS